jgi:lysophospholipase L1-like esterase
MFENGFMGVIRSARYAAVVRMRHQLFLHAHSMPQRKEPKKISMKFNNLTTLSILAALALLPSIAFGADGDVIVDVDPAKIAPFRVKIKGNDVVEKKGDMFQPFSANLWDGKSSGEAWLDEAPVEGSKAIGLANIEGQNALQMYNWKPFEVPGNRKYTLTAEYLTKGSGTGKFGLEGIPGQAFNLENTGGKWKTIKSTFEQKDAAKITTKVNVFSMGIDNPVYIKTLKLVDSGEIPKVQLAIPTSEIKIMPLGDSITEGYLEPLYNKLKAAGYKFKFVGSNTSINPTLTAAGTNNYEGHGGWFIDTLPEGLKKERGANSGIAQHIEGWMKTSNPDVVLLMVGANDVAAWWEWSKISDRYDGLVNKIFTANPKVKLLLGTVTPNKAQGYPDSNNNAQRLSAFIREIATKYQVQGKDVTLVDVNTALDPAADLRDNLHPNEGGYQKIADKWLQGLNSTYTVQAVVVPTKSIAYNDPAIKYVGRWMDKGNLMESTWDTAYLKVNFSGTTIKAKLQGEGDMVAKIDNMPEITFSKVSGTVDLSPANLPAGNHTLRLYATKGGVKIAGLAVDEKAAVSPAKMFPKLIEFVGDSITAGGGTVNFSTLASDKIGAEHIRLATGAMFLADGKNKLATWMDIRTGIATQYFRTGNIYQSQELGTSANTKQTRLLSISARTTQVKLPTNSSSSNT